MLRDAYARVRATPPRSPTSVPSTILQSERDALLGFYTSIDRALTVTCRSIHQDSWMLDLVRLGPPPEDCQ
jgi:hypothetical protein